MSAPVEFSLKIGSLDAGSFQVLKFVLKESLSACYTLDVEAKSDIPGFAFDDLVRQNAHLEVTTSEFRITHHGIVTGFGHGPSVLDASGASKYQYELRIEPKLKLLDYIVQSRIFQRMDAGEIISKVLEQAGFGAPDYAFDIVGALPKREFTVQYNESDLAFVQRLLEDEGLACFFRHEGHAECAVFTNNEDAYRILPHAHSLPFRPSTGLVPGERQFVTGFKCEQKMVNGRAKVKNYEHATPDENILAGQGDSGAEHYAYADRVKTRSEADRLAANRLQSFAWQKTIFKGEAVSPAMRTGYRFDLTVPEGNSMGGRYTVVSLTQSGKRQKASEADKEIGVVSAEFTCIPAIIPYRPPAPGRRARVDGLLVARVDGPENEYATVDEEGRYHVKLPFDLAALNPGEASLPVTFGQPYAGANYGMHFPVHNGNDVILGFVNGDADRPMVLGALPNPNHASPVTAANRSESVIRTASGHTLRMDDKRSKTVVELTTSGGHGLSMNDDPESREIRFATHGEHEVALEDTGQKIRITTKYGHSIVLDDAGKSILINTKDGHRMRLDDPSKSIVLEDGAGKTRMRMDGSGGNIEITASDDVTIRAGKRLILRSGDDSLLEAEKNVRIRAGDELRTESVNATKVSADKDFLCEATGKYRVAASAGSLEMQKELQMKAAKYLCDAETACQVKAGKVNIEADGKLVLKGAQVHQN